MKPVGLLYDSVTDNTGDRAIGVVMRRVLTAWEVPHEVVDPFAVDPAGYSRLVIGGGELLAPSGDPFYDAFRVPGQHVLNTVGVRATDDLSYLSEYDYVSVRSTSDRNVLRQSVPGLPVSVAPCASLLMEPEATDFDADGAVGVQIHQGVPADLVALVNVVRDQVDGRQIIFLPFTHYAGDKPLMEALAEDVPGACVAPSFSPGQLLHVIGRLRCVVSVSLHAVLFAYAQNVPFLAYPVTPKIEHFAADRQLEGSLFRTPGELEDRLRELLARPPDYSARYSQDRRRLDEHLRTLRDKLPSQAHALGMPSVSWQHSQVDGRSSDLRRRLHAANTRSLQTGAEHLAERIRMARRMRELEKHAANLEAALGQYSRRAEDLEKHAANLEKALGHFRRRSEDLEKHAAKLEDAVGHLRAWVAELETHQRQLGAEIERLAASQAPVQRSPGS